MFNKTLTSLLFFLSFISISVVKSHPINAAQLTLTNGDDFAIYNDNSGAGYYGFNDWQSNQQKLLTETGLFYQIGNTGTAQTLDTLTSSSIVNGNSATVNYSSTDFTIKLDLSLNNSGSTLKQTATVNNISDSSLDFSLFSYFDLVTNNGDTGDTVVINSSDYTANQSGERNIINTEVSETIIGNNTTLTTKRAEVDVINFVDDTLLQKILLLSDESLELDNDLNAITDADNPVTFAYQWDYQLDNGESFLVDITNNNVVTVPFESSPRLGIFLLGLFGAGRYLKRKFIQ